MRSIVQAGFGLVEVLIAGVVLIGISFAAISLLDMMTKQRTTIVQTSDLQLVVDSIAHTVNDDSLCGNSFFGAGGARLVFPGVISVPPVPPVLTPVEELRMGGKVLAKVGAPSAMQSKVYFDSITIEAVQRLPDQVIQVGGANVPVKKYVARLAVKARLLEDSAKRTSIGATEFRERSFNLIVFARATNDEIIKCQNSVSVAQACDDMGGLYDEASTPKCMVPKLAVNTRMASSETLYVAGDARFSGTLTSAGVSIVSDERLKKNFSAIESPLERILGLEGREFEWRDAARSNGKHLGFRAQNVERQFPEVVRADSQGGLSVDYIGLIAPITEAIRELSSKNAELERRLVKKEIQMNDLEERVRALASEKDK